VTTLAAGLRKRLFRIRSIPGCLGLRPYAIRAVGIDYGESFVTGLRSEVEILEGNGQNPKVRWLSAEQRTVGSYADGTIEVGPITPQEGSVGTALERLLLAPEAGEMARFVVTGPEYPDGVNYALREIRTDHAMHYTLTLERVA